MTDWNHNIRPAEQSAPASSGGSNAHEDMQDAAGTVVPGFGKASVSLAEALRYENPEYLASIDKWEKFVDVYDSRDMAKYLYRHLRESPDMYDQRARRGYFFNYCRSIVDLTVAHLFSAPIVRTIPEDQQDDFEDLYKDADRAGTPYPRMVKDAKTYANVVGIHGLLVDMPVMPSGGFANESARREAEHRPYLVHVFGWQIKDWELDEFGNFVWVKLEVPPDLERSFREYVDESVRHFVVWDAQTWTRYELRESAYAENADIETGGEAVEVDSGVHALGKVPLTIFYGDKKASHSWLGRSQIFDLADINIALFNWCSLADEEIFERCLNILAMEKMEDSVLELSHHNVLEYPEGSMHPPEYLTPGATPLEMIGQWIDRARRESYRIARIGREDEKGRASADSGIAFAFQFNETNQMLADQAEGLETSETDVHNNYMLWHNKEFEGSIEYPREFGVTDFLMEFQILAEARATLTSDEALKRLEEKTVLRLHHNEDPEFIQGVLAEIRKADPRQVGPMADLMNMLPPPPSEGRGEKSGSEPSDTGKPGQATSASS